MKKSMKSIKSIVTTDRGINIIKTAVLAAVVFEASNIVFKYGTAALAHSKYVSNEINAIIKHYEEEE